MNIGRTSMVVSVVLAAAVAFPTVGRADEKKKPRAPRNVIVEFGQPQPQTPAPAPVGNAVTHFLAPDDRHRAARSYGGNGDRLLSAKRHYDPDNVFRSANPLPVDQAAQTQRR